MNGIKEFRIFYIILLIMSAILSIVYVSRLMPILFLTLCFVPVISFILLIINYKSIKISQTPNELVIEKKENCLLKIIIRNRFIFPIFPIKINGLFFSGEDKNAVQRVIITNIKPLSEIYIEMPFTPLYRGEYFIRVESFEIFDLFKLFNLKKKLNCVTTVVVLPNKIELNNIKNVNESETENSQGTVVNFSGNSFSSFREYRMGDNLRHVHWKLTAKQGDLIVKQLEKNANNNSIIFCDFTVTDENYGLHGKKITEETIVQHKSKKIKLLPVKKTKTVIESRFDENYYLMAADAVIETALAISKKIFDDGNSPIICWQNSENGNNEYFEISDIDLFWQLYYLFAILPPEPADKKFYELIDLYIKEINEEQVVYIITNKIDRDFLRYLEERGLTMRKDVILLLFRTTDHKIEDIEYIKRGTKIIFKLIDVVDLEKSLPDVLV